MDRIKIEIILNLRRGIYVKNYDVAVVGGGPAGIMAAIHAAELKKDVVLIERNDSLGRKLLITGSGRCNLTNTAETSEFIEKFGRKGSFLRSAFKSFSNKDTMEFFKSRGLNLKVEDGGRVFPVTDDADSVLNLLRSCLKEAGVSILYDHRLSHVDVLGNEDETSFKLNFDNSSLKAKCVVISTGGASYPATGSTGDGFRVASELGHRILPLKPGSVPLKTLEKWIWDIQGTSLEDVGLTFKRGKKKIASGEGDVIFTHFGISGPAVLDLSLEVVSALEKGEVQLLMDLKPEIGREDLEEELLKEFEKHGKTYMKNFLKFLMPNRLIPVFLELGDLDPNKTLNQISKHERNSMLNILKSMPLTITGHLPLEKAMVTCGGVSKKEINPQTMESNICQGIYFAGEIIDLCAPTGGYNLQEAFSTGYLAGDSAARSDE